MTRFQQADYPHQYIRIHTATNSSLKAETISVVTDLSLVFMSVRPTKEKICKIPFILECAFTQPHNEVFDKVEELTVAQKTVPMFACFSLNAMVPNNP